MTIDIQLVYIFVLLFTCMVLICMVLISLYLATLSKLSKSKINELSSNEQKLLDNVQKDLISKLDNAVSKIIDQVTTTWSKESSIVFEKNVKTLEINLVNKLNQIYKNESDSLENYKKTKLEDFETNLNSQIKKLSREILKREIDIDTHKKLIQEGLNNAIKNGLFK